MYSGGNSGFTDLRVGHGARGIGDDSVWPSFTDIMTVIVMIFLMALVIMMVRNFELDRQLTTTVSAREASLLENRNLVSRLNILEARVAGLRGSLGESVSERDALRAQLLDELRRIELLAADNVNLEEQLAAIIEERNLLTREKQQLVEQGEAARGRITALTATEEALREEIAALSGQFGDLQLSSGRQIESLTFANRSLSEQLTTVSSQLSDLIAASGREIEALTRANLSLSQQLEAVSSQLSRLQLSSGREIESLTGANLSLSEQLDSVSLQLNELIETSGSEIESLTRANLSLSEQLEAVSSQLSQLQLSSRQEIESLSGQLTAVSSQLGDLTAASGREIESLTGANLSLSEQLEAVSSQLSALQLSSRQEIESLTEQLTAVSSQLGDLTAASGRQIESLTGANLSLSQQREALLSQLAQVRGLLETEQQQRRALGTRVEEQDLELSTKRQLLEALQLSEEQAAQRNIDARAEIERLEGLIRRRQAENAALQELADAAGEQFRSLQQEYEALDAKYRDLVRPARSPAGKYVVDVRFSKWDGQYRFQLQEPAQSRAADYSREQLARRQLSLCLEVQPDLPDVLSDPRRLEPMLGGLIDRVISHPNEA